MIGSQKQQRSLSVLFLSSLLFFLVAEVDCHGNHTPYYYYIKNPSTGLVLDASEYVIGASHELTERQNAQLWSLEPFHQGTYMIINKETERPLDARGGSFKGHEIVTYWRHYTINQRWYVNSDGTIVCESRKPKELALQLHKDKTVTIEPKNGKSNQIFDFVIVTL